MRKLAVALSFLLLSSHAFALDVAGVNVARRLPPSRNAAAQRAGVRKAYLTVKVYVGALYTEKKSVSTDELLKDPATSSSG